jgi:hypothetical protein
MTIQEMKAGDSGWAGVRAALRLGGHGELLAVPAAELGILPESGPSVRFHRRGEVLTADRWHGRGVCPETVRSSEGLLACADVTQQGTADDGPDLYHEHLRDLARLADDGGPHPTTPPAQ